MSAPSAPLVGRDFTGSTPAPRLRLITAPAWVEPPPQAAAGVPGQQSLALEFLLPNGLPAIPALPGPEISAEGADPEVWPWAARLAQAVIEVEAADRPVMQLGQWVLPSIYRRLDRRQQLRVRQLDARATRNRCPEHVRSVHVCRPSPDIAEVSVVTGGTDRCRALALRLERRKGRWMCTALDWA
ncbi:MAG: Rv3235 family protein [Actinomycetia bacterium]|nr:Rv3235 family protein [Actinomycetes bacterium]